MLTVLYKVKRFDKSLSTFHVSFIKTVNVDKITNAFITFFR